MSLSSIGFVLVYLGLIWASFTKSPIFALYAYLWTFYEHPPSHWWGAELPDLRWSLVAAGVAMYVATRGDGGEVRSPWYHDSGARILMAYVAWMWVQTLWAVSPDAHMDGVVLFTKYVVLFAAIVRIVRDERSLQLFFWGHVAGCFLLGWAAYTTVTSGRLEMAAAPGVDDSNLLAAHLVTGACFAGFLLLGVKGAHRWLALVAMPFMLNAIILTASRGGALCMVASGLASLVLAPKGLRIRVVAGAVLGAVLFLSLARNDLFWDRMESVTAGESEMDQSALSRFAIAEAEWEMFLDYPLGAGYRGDEALSPHYVPRIYLAEGIGRRSAHNTTMAVLVDQGLPGIVLLIVLQFSIAVRVLRGSTRVSSQGTPLGLYRAALGAAFAGYFISGLFVNQLKAEVQIWMMALLASLDAMEKAHPESGQTHVGETRDVFASRSR